MTRTETSFACVQVPPAMDLTHGRAPSAAFGTGALRSHVSTLLLNGLRSPDLPRRSWMPLKGGFQWQREQQRMFPRLSLLALSSQSRLGKMDFILKSFVSSAEPQVIPSRLRLD